MSCGIYKITSPSNKIYIGQSKDIDRRWKGYKKYKAKAQTILCRSFLKYGTDNHIFEIIEECDINDLNIRERYWQDYYDVLNKGLNCELVNTDNLTKIFSEETLIRMSTSKIGNKNPMFNRKQTDEFKKSVSENNRNRIVSKETRLKMSESGKRKIITEEHKLNMSISGKKRIWSETEINNLRERNIKRLSKKVINIENGIIYNSCKEAAKILNINYGTLKSKLNGNDRNNTNLKYFAQ